MGIQLVTLGGLQVRNGVRELDRLLTQRSRAALFIYLTIERRVARDALMAMFWPESDEERASHALRQSLYHLSKLVGGRDWLRSHPHELVVGDDIAADASAFADAAARGDADRAVRLYQGRFLEGLHLLDLRSWESWVDGRRSKYSRLFRRACRALIDIRLAEHDHGAAIALAERWTALDPTDDEAQHRLISTLLDAGERVEAIRQYEMYVRLLASEGLEPLDETRDLIERLRAQRQRITPSRILAAPVQRVHTRCDALSQ
jgi:DNA-binding SARP family transcriptional activator